MWAGVGVLLGLMVVSSVLGFHVGPHGHLAAFGLGVAAAVLLVVMAATGQAAPLLWVLLGADVSISGALGVIAWRALHMSDDQLTGPATVGIVGAPGVAVTDLAPDGIVKVRGENWSATSMNGSVKAGHRVQVIEAAGVRLGVWSEDDEIAAIENHHRLPGTYSGNHEADENQEGAQ